MDIRIREGTRRDREMIWRATVETAWNDLPEEERHAMRRAALEEHFRPSAERVLDSRENAVFVAEGPAGEPLGYTIVGGATAMMSPMPFGFVYDLWVAPGARRQGTARRLLKQAFDWCRVRGFPRVKLEVSATNAAARALYAASGFAEERIFMGKTL